nr:hypothetical protein [Microbacterium sp. NIBRBAC000506063]
MRQRLVQPFVERRKTASVVHGEPCEIGVRHLTVPDDVADIDVREREVVRPELKARVVVHRAQESVDARRRDSDAHQVAHEGALDDG